MSPKSVRQLFGAMANLSINFGNNLESVIIFTVSNIFIPC